MKQREKFLQNFQDKAKKEREHLNHKTQNELKKDYLGEIMTNLLNGFDEFI